jgi:hypothetical protein
MPKRHQSHSGGTDAEERSQEISTGTIDGVEFIQLLGKVLGRTASTEALNQIQIGGEVSREKQQQRNCQWASGEWQCPPKHGTSVPLGGDPELGAERFFKIGDRLLAFRHGLWVLGSWAWD